jgi:hypothetical protein
MQSAREALHRSIDVAPAHDQCLYRNRRSSYVPGDRVNDLAQICDRLNPQLFFGQPNQSSYQLLARVWAKLTPTRPPRRRNRQCRDAQLYYRYSIISNNRIERTVCHLPHSFPLSFASSLSLLPRSIRIHLHEAHGISWLPLHPRDDRLICRDIVVLSRP